MLSGDRLGAGFVDFLFLGQHLGARFVSSSGKLVGLLGHFALLVAQPLLEFLLGLLLGHGTLLDTIQKVVVVHNTLVLEDGPGRIAHFCTDLQPIQGTVVHHIDCSGVGVGIVCADFLDETAVALCAGISGDNVVEGLAFLTVTLESEAGCHVKNVLKGSETLLLIL